MKNLLSAVRENSYSVFDPTSVRSCVSEATVALVYNAAYNRMEDVLDNQMKWPCWGVVRAEATEVLTNEKP